MPIAPAAPATIKIIAYFKPSLFNSYQNFNKLVPVNDSRVNRNCIKVDKQFKMMALAKQTLSKKLNNKVAHPCSCFAKKAGK